MIEARFPIYPRNLSSLKFTMLNASNDLLVGYKNDLVESDFQNWFSLSLKVRTAKQFFIISCVKGTLEFKDNSFVAALSLFTAAS